MVKIAYLKKNSGDVKDCFEGFNRATFSLNQGLDKAIFKPVARGYRKLPSRQSGLERVMPLKIFLHS